MKKIKKLLRKLKNNLIDLLLYKLVSGILKLLPVKERQVLFLSDSRKEIGGNLVFVYDYIKEKNYKIKENFIKSNFHKRSIKEEIKLIKEIRTSKYIIIEDWMKSIAKIKPKKNQEYVQLWHGAGAFKKFGNARLSKKDKEKNTGHQNYTKAIVSSEEIRKCYAESYNIDISKVQATGIPRTDIFFDENYKEKIKKEFYEKYPELKDKKIVIFAPTLRTSITSVSSAYYDFEMLDLEYLQKKLGKEYAVIIKWHPFIYNKLELNKLRFKCDKYKKFVYDMSNERDINDLLIIADTLITDYSSVIFDYYLLNKPVIYYTYDLDKYTSDRGFYFDFDEYVYGRCASNIEELVSAIKQNDMCSKKREKFGKKFMEACDGKSTEKVVKYIFENNNK